MAVMALCPSIDYGLCKANAGAQELKIAAAVMVHPRSLRSLPASLTFLDVASLHQLNIPVNWHSQPYLLIMLNRSM